MAYKSQREILSAFQNQQEDFLDFQAPIISSKDIANYCFDQLNVAMIGTDQHTVSHLENISLSANSFLISSGISVFIKVLLS